jgi:O-antigen/teichoic acid export membrane protein
LKNSSAKIVHNSFWYGLETITEIVVFLGTSIAVARYLGPAKLGYFSYINFFVVIVTRTSGTGLSTATRKYMSEFLALGRPGTARAVYNLAHRYQLIGAVGIAALGVAGIALFGEPQYRLMSSILIVSIVPGLMSWVPAQANQAFEDVSKNTLSAFGYLVAYSITTVLAIHFRWDLVGIAAASLVGRSVEVVLRTIPLNAILRKLPLDPLDSEIVHRIRRFCIQAVGLQLLMSVVWDRSEMVFLRYFSSLEQTAFYSVSFSLATNLLTLPRVFGAATGITLMTEAVKSPERVNSLVQNACRYMLLIAVPVCLGAAAITRPAVGVGYGSRYLGAVPVLIIAAILSIPRAFQAIPEILLRTGDLQNRILVWYSITGVINIAADFLLIPRYGAVGAAWGNGLSQCFGVLVIWQQARRFYTFRFPVQAAVRLTIASTIMAVIAFFIGRSVPRLPGLLLAVITAVPIYIVLLRLFHGLEPSDRDRLAPIGKNLPGAARRAYFATIEFVTPEA